MDHRSDVVRIAQPPRGYETRQQGVEVVVVGFGMPKLGRQGRVGVRVEHGIDLRTRESGGGKEGAPAVVLGGLGDGFVLGGELADVAPPFLLGGDRLVRGQFGADVLDHAVEHRPGGGVRVVAGVRHPVAVVGPIEDNVGIVPGRAAGHGDVEVLPRRGRGRDDVRRVGRHSLGSMGGDGVAEVEVFGHVVGGQDDSATEPAADRADADRPVRVNAGDGPAVAVADPGSAVA